MASQRIKLIYPGFDYPHGEASVKGRVNSILVQLEPPAYKKPMFDVLLKDLTLISIVEQVSEIVDVLQRTTDEIRENVKSKKYVGDIEEFWRDVSLTRPKQLLELIANLSLFYANNYINILLRVGRREGRLTHKVIEYIKEFCKHVKDLYKLELDEDVLELVKREEIECRGIVVRDEPHIPEINYLKKLQAILRMQETDVRQKIVFSKKELQELEKIISLQSGMDEEDLGESDLRGYVDSDDSSSDDSDSDDELSPVQSELMPSLQRASSVESVPPSGQVPPPIQVPSYVMDSPLPSSPKWLLPSPDKNAGKRRKRHTKKHKKQSPKRKQHKRSVRK
jgi:hypothetical protein